MAISPDINIEACRTWVEKVRTAYEQGAAAALAGKPASQTPNFKQDMERIAWREGWTNADFGLRNAHWNFDDGTEVPPHRIPRSSGLSFWKTLTHWLSR